jgi:hypothetical protein
LTYQRILAGNTAIYVFPLCILLVFLVLAAQYESFRLPLAIILVAPRGGRTEQEADLRHLTAEAHLVVEDPTLTAQASEFTTEQMFGPIERLLR